MRVLDVVNGVLLGALLREVDIELDRLVMSPRDEEPASGVHSDRVEEVVEEDDVAAPLGHLLRPTLLAEVHELIDENFERAARVSEHLGKCLQPADVAVMIGPQDIDEPIETSPL